MEANNWKQKDFINTILNNKNEIGLYQFIRIVEKYFSDKEIKYSSYLGLEFPISDVSDISISATQVNIEQNLISFIGSNGILPDHFTELVYAQKEKKDEALKDFLDLFINKFIKLYYESWKAGQFPIQYENNDGDYTLQFLTALLGVDESIVDKHLRKHCYLYYANILIQKTRSKQGLINILGRYFNVPISISEFDGQWVDVSKDERSCISKISQYNQLNKNIMLGTRVWHIQNRFLIVIGAVCYKKFLQLLPNKPMLEMMREIIKFYSGSEFVFHIKVIVEYATIPICQLKSHTKQEKYGLQLGWNTWLKSSSQNRKNPSIYFRND